MNGRVANLKHVGTHPTKAASVEKQRKALELRKAGATVQQIADALGYANHSSASRAIKSALRATIQEPADELRVLECERLDAMMRAHWPAVMNGHVRSTEVVLRIMERRAELLGLDRKPPDDNGNTFNFYANADYQAMRSQLMRLFAQDQEAAIEVAGILVEPTGSDAT